MYGYNVETILTSVKIKASHTGSGKSIFTRIAAGIDFWKITYEAMEDGKLIVTPSFGSEEYVKTKISPLPIGFISKPSPAISISKVNVFKLPPKKMLMFGRYEDMLMSDSDLELDSYKAPYSGLKSSAQSYWPILHNKSNKVQRIVTIYENPIKIVLKDDTLITPDIFVFAIINDKSDFEIRARMLPTWRQVHTDMLFFKKGTTIFVAGSGINEYTNKYIGYLTNIKMPPPK